MSEQDHGASSGQAQALIEGVEQPCAEQQKRAAAERRQRLRQGPARLRQARREQVELLVVDLDSVLPADHQARLVWGYVERQDWSEFEDRIKARGSAPGRRAIDPRILFALWLYATLQGVGSGREVARLSRTHDAYRWICGGVGVNYHALNDFRAKNERWFDELLSSQGPRHSAVARPDPQPQAHVRAGPASAANTSSRTAVESVRSVKTEKLPPTAQRPTCASPSSLTTSMHTQPATGRLAVPSATSDQNALWL